MITDDDDDDDRDPRYINEPDRGDPDPAYVDDQAALLARSYHLQELLMAVLNEPAERWASEPCTAAHAIAEVLARLLGTIVMFEPARLAWACELLDSVRQHPLDASTLITRARRETRH
jgi:hypothetical protein